jgi:hypothetical protein
MDTKGQTQEDRMITEYVDCKKCDGKGDYIDPCCGMVPPIVHCEECDGKGYHEADAESCEQEEPRDEFYSDELADIAAGAHFAARGY